MLFPPFLLAFSNQRRGEGAAGAEGSAFAEVVQAARAARGRRAALLAALPAAQADIEAPLSLSVANLCFLYITLKKVAKSESPRVPFFASPPPVQKEEKTRGEEMREEACDAAAAAAREHAAKAALEAERHSHRAELEGVQVSTRCFLLVVDFGNFRDAWEFLCDSEAVQALSSMTCGLPVKKLQSILILLVNDRTISRTKS